MNATDTRARLLVVDDDTSLLSLLQRYLTENGYRVDTASDGESMFTCLAAHRPELIILDLMLPGEDGLSLAKKIRSRDDTPIIILSARGDEVDRIVGLEVGADDYLPKPFNPRELLARIRSVLRRSRGDRSGDEASAGAEHEHTPEEIRFGNFRLLPQSRQLFRNQDEISLTEGEYSLLEVFVNNANRVLNRDSLLQLLKGYEHLPYDRSIDVRVVRLRRKIEDDPAHPVYIRTVWGQGYIFTPQADRQPDRTD